jgi:hypothetical protein
MPPRLVHLRDILAFDYQFGPLQGGRMPDVGHNVGCDKIRLARSPIRGYPEWRAAGLPLRWLPERDGAPK